MRDGRDRGRSRTHLENRVFARMDTSTAGGNLVPIMSLNDLLKRAILPSVVTGCVLKSRGRHLTFT